MEAEPYYLFFMGGARNLMGKGRPEVSSRSGVGPGRFVEVRGAAVAGSFLSKASVEILSSGLSITMEVKSCPGSPLKSILGLLAESFPAW